MSSARLCVETSLLSVVLDSIVNTGAALQVSTQGFKAFPKGLIRPSPLKTAYAKRVARTFVSENKVLPTTVLFLEVLHALEPFFADPLIVSMFLICWLTRQQVTVGNGRHCISAKAVSLF